MKTFALTRANDSAQAIATAAKATTAQQGADIRFIGGGTTLIDLMKLNVEQPKTVIDINRLPLDKIEALPDGGVTIGATVRNSDLAHHPLVRKNYNVLSEAIVAGVPVLASRIAGNIGILGQRYPGLFRVGDARELRQGTGLHDRAPVGPDRHRHRRGRGERGGPASGGEEDALGAHVTARGAYAGYVGPQFG